MLSVVDPIEPRRVSVEYVEQPCRSALNRVRGMPFNWSLNPYMGCEHRCTFCYVRAFEARADRPFDDRYGRSVRVKTNVVEVLRAELARKSWKREGVAIGAATDPYQPAEGRYRLTRGCLEVFCDRRNPVALITRGPRIVRDLDVLTALARAADLSITFSIPTLDDAIWRRTEPGTAHPRQRLRALERLSAAGLRVGVGMAPLLPGLTDRPDLLEEVIVAARDAGAAHVWASVLNLRPGTREHFLATLSRHWPELLPRYLRLYGGRAYLPAAETSPPARRVAELARRHAIGGRPSRLLRPAPEPPAPEQLTLLAG